MQTSINSPEQLQGCDAVPVLSHPRPADLPLFLCIEASIPQCSQFSPGKTKLYVSFRSCIIGAFQDKRSPLLVKAHIQASGKDWSAFKLLGSCSMGSGHSPRDIPFCSLCRAVRTPLAGALPGRVVGPVAGLDHHTPHPQQLQQPHLSGMHWEPTTAAQQPHAAFGLGAWGVPQRTATLYQGAQVHPSTCSLTFHPAERLFPAS